MSKPHGIIVFGASGSGTTTLGRELAQILRFKHVDADDFFWAESAIPFTVKRPREERFALLLAAIDGERGFVLSGSICGWDEPILPLLDLAVFVSTPTEIRIDRLRKRELAQFGERILPGGDMEQSHNEFLEWAASYDAGGTDQRSRALHEQWAQSLRCPVIRVDGTEDVRKTAATLAAQFYTKPGEPWRVYTTLLGELSPYRFVVIFARYQGKWLYARHKKRTTWETAGGHIEPGETPYEAAVRELQEETGAIPVEVVAVFDYTVHTEIGFSYGRVFFAEIERLGDLPESEMAETRLFDSIPDMMTYPQILPVLYEKLQHHLATQSSPDEVWDVYDADRKLTGRTHRRGDPLPQGDYHLVVHVWLMNSKGEFLITRRAPEKHYPLLWETPGGSAVTGDDSLTAAIREVKEETGLDALPENGKIVIAQKRDNDFCDIWLFRQDFDLDKVVLQEGETIDAKYASPKEIRRMIAAGEFIAFDYLDELLGSEAPL